MPHAPHYRKRPIARFTLWFRIFKMQWLAACYGLDDILFSLPLLKPLAALRWIFPWNWFSRQKKLSRAKRLRLFLERCGPIYVKLGQALSTREDLIPSDIIIELAKLQDNVPPFDGEIAKKLIEKSYEQTIEQLFASFDTQPLASASIAQVHPATLHSGEDVVIKVLRPKIKRIIKRDIEVLYALATLAEQYSEQSRRLRLVEVVEEYDKTITDELNLMHEAANASQLKRNFVDSNVIYVPEIHWDYARDNMIVMERIYGVAVSDITALNAAGTDMKLLAERGVEIFFSQVFRDSFFHADMHPGNVFVDISNPTDPKYIAIDFGIVGTLSKDDQRYLAENLLAFFNRDYRRVAELHVESGWVPKDTRVDEFENTIRTVCEPVFNKPLSEISFGRFLLSLFNTARRFDMQVQPQLVLLQKTLLHIEGLGRILYPQLDLWQTGKPILEKWMHDRIGISGILEKTKQQIPKFAAELPDIPMRALQLLRDAEKGDLQVRINPDSLKTIESDISNKIARKQNQKLGFLLLIVAIGLLTYRFLPWSISLEWLSLAILALGLGFLIK